MDEQEDANEEDYDVEWSITVSAKDEKDAVRQAWGVMHDPQSTATYFRVTNRVTGKTSLRDYEQMLREMEGK